MEDKFKKTLFFISTSGMIIGFFFFITEFYSLAVYSIGAERYLPGFLHFRSNHMNTAVLLLCYWLILFSHYLHKRKVRTLSILAALFGFYWVFFWFIGSWWHIGSVFYFYVPIGFSRIVLYVDSALSIGVLAWFLWREADKEEDGDTLPS